MALKILFISHKFNPDIGGIEAHSEILANAYSEAGDEVHLITWSNTLSTKNFSYQVIRNPSVRQLLREHRWADLVFENNPSLKLSWPSFLFKKPNIVVLHTWITRTSGKTAWQDKLKYLWLKRASKVLSCSDAVRKTSWAQSVVIPNPYQEKLFRVLPNIVRSKDFVFLGRLVSDKGVDLAIKAFSSILNQNQESGILETLTLTIIGDGAERKKLEAEVLKLGLQANVTFTGALSGEPLVECLNKHKFLIVPSRWEEPFGMVALEGMACGCIPIVSDGGGLPEAVGDAGLTFKRGDVQDLALSMLKILQNPDLQQCRRNAAESHLKSHQSKVVAERYRMVIDEVLKGED